MTGTSRYARPLSMDVRPHIRIDFVLRQPAAPMRWVEVRVRCMVVSLPEDRYGDWINPGVHGSTRRSYLSPPRSNTNRAEPLESSMPTVRPRVSVVVPTLNEERNLPHVFGRGSGDVHEVIVVDGGSTDGTVEVARELLPDVKVVHQTRRGKGNALACGFAAAHRRHHRDARRRRLDRPGRDPALRRGARATAPTSPRARASARAAAAHDITRAPPARQPGLNARGQHAVRHRATPTSATATTPSGAGCCPISTCPTTCPPAGDGTKLWGDGFEIETLINIRVAAAGLRVAEVPSVEARPHARREQPQRRSRDGWRVLRTIVRESPAPPAGVTLDRPGSCPATGACAGKPTTGRAIAPHTSTRAAWRPDSACRSHANGTCRTRDSRSAQHAEPRPGRPTPPASSRRDHRRPSAWSSRATPRQRWPNCRGRRLGAAQEPAPAEVVVVVDHNEALFGSHRQAYPAGDGPGERARTGRVGQPQHRRLPHPYADRGVARRRRAGTARDGSRPWRDRSPTARWSAPAAPSRRAGRPAARVVPGRVLWAVSARTRR